MSITRNKVKLPVRSCFERLHEYNLFSPEYRKTRHDYSEWRMLLEHASRMENSCRQLNVTIYPSRLFMAYVDILEANLYVFNDLFYFITGEQVSDNLYDNPQFFNPFDFWDMGCYKEIGQIHECIVRTDSYLYNCLNQGPLQPIFTDVVARTGWYTDYEADYPPQSIREKRAYFRVQLAYKEPLTDEDALIVQLVRIQHFLGAYKVIFSSPSFDTGSFPWLLAQFRKSPMCQEFISSWSYDLSGSLRDLESSIKESDKLGRWWPKVKNVPIRAVYETLDFTSEDERHNPENWIQILKIYALIAEYEDHQNQAKEEEKKPEMPKKPRKIKTFREFVKDAERSEEIMGKLHRLIGNKTNTAALKVITQAMWINWIEQPTAPSIKNEFPTITCSDQYISKCLNESPPTRKSMIDKIIQEFEQA